MVESGRYVTCAFALALVMGTIQDASSGASILPLLGSAVAGGGSGLLLGMFIAAEFV